MALLLSSIRNSPSVATLKIIYLYENNWDDPIAHENLAGLIAEAHNLEGSNVANQLQKKKFKVEVILAGSGKAGRVSIKRDNLFKKTLAILPTNRTKQVTIY